MNISNQISRFFVLMLLISLAGCIKSGDFDFNKVKDIEWNPKLAIPLVSSNLTIMDLIKQVGDSSYFVIDDQGFVTLVYKDRLFSVNPNTIYTIPPASMSISHTITESEATNFNTFDTLTIFYEHDIKLVPGDTTRVDSLILNKGDLTFTISGTVNINGSISLTIPNATKNGIPLNITYSPLTEGTKSIDLSGYKFDLTKVAGNTSTIRINAALTISNSPGGSINAGDIATLDVGLQNESIKLLSGYLGRFKLIQNQKITNINLFNKSISVGRFVLTNPYFLFTFHNSIGLPVNIKFTEIKGESNETGETINLVGNPGIPNPVIISSPHINDADPVKVSTVGFDNAGTNNAISDLLNLLKPGKFIYSFYSITNPNGEQGENYLRDSSRLDVDVELGLPLQGLVKNFAIQDTFDFKFNNIDEVESMLIRTIIDNEFPVDASMQVYFTDSNYGRLDSLVNSTDLVIIPAAQVDLNTGKLTSSTKKISDFSYSRDRINKIVSAEKILVKAVLNTSGSATQNIKIYNTYSLKVKLATQVEIKKQL
jgi:hypothetical protein